MMNAKWLTTVFAIGLIAAACSRQAPPPPPPEVTPEATDPARAATAAAAKADDAKPQAKVGDWLVGEARVTFDLNHHLTDQDGRTVALGDFKGKPMAVSFFFTRCPNPQMCPLIIVTMANLQRELEKAGLEDKVHTLLISYDPVYDTPERMKKFGADRGFRFKDGGMLRPSVEDYRDLLTDLSISVQPLPDGTFNHIRELLLIDAQGRFVRDYHGAIWDNHAVLADLRKLVEETPPEAPPETPPETPTTAPK